MRRTAPANRSLQEAASRVADDAKTAGVPASGPLRDTSIDDLVRALPAYPRFVASLQKAKSAALYGRPNVDRWALAWVYGIVSDAAPPLTWGDYWQQFTDPHWHFVSLANVANFDSDADEIAFPDGLIIRTRDRSALSEITGWSEQDLFRTLGADWMEGTGAYGRFVMVAIDALEKEPDNLVQSNTGREWVRMARLLQALRLYGAGDIALGPVFSHRVEHFPVGIGSYSRSGWRPNPSFSAHYFLMGAEQPSVSHIYEQLGVFDLSQAAHLRHVVTALTRFGTAYDRPWFNSADRLIDDTIALEALVGTSGPELTYTLATRVSGLLAENDGERVALFERVRSFYATRSRLVHGDSLRAREQADVQQEPELRDMVRRLLRGFLNLAGSVDFFPSRPFIERLDVKLLDGVSRDRLRTAMASGPASALPAANTGPQTIPLWADQPPSSAMVGPVVGDP